MLRINKIKVKFDIQRIFINSNVINEVKWVLISAVYLNRFGNACDVMHLPMHFSVVYYCWNILAKGIGWCRGGRNVRYVQVLIKQGSKMLPYRTSFGKNLREFKYYIKISPDWEEWFKGKNANGRFYLKLISGIETNI